MAQWSEHANSVPRKDMGSTPVSDSDFLFFSLSRSLNEHLSQELYSFQVHFKIMNFYSFHVNGLVFHCRKNLLKRLDKLHIQCISVLLIPLSPFAYNNQYGKKVIFRHLSLFCNVGGMLVLTKFVFRTIIGFIIRKRDGIHSIFQEQI